MKEILKKNTVNYGRDCASSDTWGEILLPSLIFPQHISQGFF